MVMVEVEGREKKKREKKKRFFIISALSKCTSSSHSIECRSPDFAPPCLQRCSKPSALRAFAPWASVSLSLGREREK